MPPALSSQEETGIDLNRRFCVAPMMDYTDRHHRFLLRLITKYSLLYTEMITSSALLHGDRDRLLQFDPAEHPVALQIGGSDPTEMAACARFAEDFGYDEVNINVGCPSNRVQSGRFGACLMAEPEIVADCVAAMLAAVKIPVTVKTRIGIDRDESLDHLSEFVDVVSMAGCDTFIVHARRAWLDGISPKQNREIPPLNYQRVYELKQGRPELTVIINGGIKTMAEIARHLDKVDGVMMGREAYAAPFKLAVVDRIVFGGNKPEPNQLEVLERYLDYCQREVSRGCALHHMSRHLSGFFQGQPGARRWRRQLSQSSQRDVADLDMIRQAARYPIRSSESLTSSGC